MRELRLPAITTQHRAYCHPTRPDPNRSVTNQSAYASVPSFYITYSQLDAVLCTDFTSATLYASAVCSVALCLSVTCRYCIETAEYCNGYTVLKGDSSVSKK